SSAAHAQPRATPRARARAIRTGARTILEHTEPRVHRHALPRRTRIYRRGKQPGHCRRPHAENGGTVSMARSADEAAVIAKQAVEMLAEELPIGTAILFGSYVEGSPDTDSDIDLAVFTPDESRLKLNERARLQLDLQRRCAMDLELHLY